MSGKILLTSVSAGAGHVRAAQAIEAALAEAHPKVSVVHLDCMDLVPRAFRKLYVEGYLAVVNRAPALWGYFYERTDRARPDAKSDRILNGVQRAALPRLLERLEEERPDRIVSTHFLVPQLLAGRPRRGRRRVPLDVVVTDYDVHRLWIQEGVDRYFTATDRIAHRLGRRGVPETRIAVTGIPIHPSFSAPVDAAAVRRGLALADGTPTLLLLAGGLGIGALGKTVAALCETDRALQIVSVAGKNARLKEEIDRIAPRPNVRLRSLGFVSNMHELLAIADVVVTKPGGLTTSECLARGTAMAILSPIPGQEERNADHVLESGAGVKAVDLEDLEFQLARLLSDPARVARMRAAARAAARPRAAFAIADAAVAGLA